MARWKSDARLRMQEAALELFAERGYTQTTAADVAERAGLTERTFFRHFSDKREVLFASGDDLRTSLVAALDVLPEGATPREVIGTGLGALVTEFRPTQDVARKRARVIAAYPELQERELIKLASWSDVFEEALLRLGQSKGVAKVASEVAVAVFSAAFQRWTEDEQEKNLAELLDEALNDLQTVAKSSH